MNDSLNSTAEPTLEMVERFERRTAEHIARVQRCLAILAERTRHGEALNERGRQHDASKHSEEERVPYIWLTEYHRCRFSGESFCYPAGMQERVSVAIEHHMRCNRHHPEYHADVNDMTDVDLIEMVCDWTAMAQEFAESGNSARGWADRTIGHRVMFNAERTAFVYRMIDLLDAGLRDCDQADSR